MKRWLISTILCLLLFTLLPACGDGGGQASQTFNDKEPTPTPIRPVKIGVIMPWSGPVAMSGQMVDQIIPVVEQQLKDKGGVLGGMEVEFVRGDDRGQLAESVGQARKLTLDDKVTILTGGGISGCPSYH